MAEFIALMHNDARQEIAMADWETYLDHLLALGVLSGGSALGTGLCVRLDGPVPDLTDHIVGYIKIDARDIDHVQELLPGNPVFDAGGTIEIRELPATS